jgi:hypothetical protein
MSEPTDERPSAGQGPADETADTPQTRKPGNAGWVERLAQKSTGLPQERSAEPKRGSEDKTLWQYAGLGLQMGLTILLFAFLGYEIDKRMGWSPWGLVTASMLAVVGNMYLLVKESLKDERKRK